MPDHILHRSDELESNMPRFSFVLPTRNRPDDIRLLLENLSEQSVLPDQVVIIDSSEHSQAELLEEYPLLNLIYRRFQGKPSAAAQRNAGLAHVPDEVELIGFVDDDIQFEEDAFEKMIDFWRTAPADVCGVAFNLVEDETVGKGGLKYFWLAEKLGLYRASIGAVAPSGWHTRLGNVKENSEVEWLISGAALWRREVLEKHRFDPFFQGYSYLEDLDFSYGVSRECKLMIVADAVFHHHHHHQYLNADWYDRFGRMEVRNRLYFVRKHGLSVWRCYVGLCVRLGQTLLEALFQNKAVLFSRARGNIAGVWDSLNGSSHE